MKTFSKQFYNSLNIKAKEKKRPCNAMKNFMWNVIEPRFLKDSIWLQVI